MKKIFFMTSILWLISGDAFSRGGHKKIMKEACESKKAGDVCSFEGRSGTIEGTCSEGRRDASVLFCKDPNRGGKDFKLLSQLNLTNEQLEKIEKFKKSHKKKHEKQKGVGKESREKMKELFLAGSSDSSLKVFHEKINKSHNLRGDLKFQKMIFLKNLLTKEQRKAYIELREKRKGHDRKRRRE